MNPQFEALLAGPFRRYLEAWFVILNPWVLFFEQPAMSDPQFDISQWKEGKNG